MRPLIWILMSTVLLCAACTQGEQVASPDSPADKATAQPASLPATVRRLLAEAGATSYSLRADYGGGIKDLYLGYDAEERIVVGIALRSTKTYAEATTIVAVTPSEGGYTVTAADIPELESFHGYSQELAAEALAKIQGTVLADAAAARGLVDAVSGATQYYQAIFVSYALMSRVVIEQIEAQPAWPRIALQP